MGVVGGLRVWQAAARQPPAHTAWVDIVWVPWVDIVWVPWCVLHNVAPPPVAGGGPSHELEVFRVQPPRLCGVLFTGEPGDIVPPLGSSR